jgi:hypothetical protein
LAQLVADLPLNLLHAAGFLTRPLVIEDYQGVLKLME